MIEEPPLLTIRENFPRPAAAEVAALAGAQTSHLADCMLGRGALDYRIKPLSESQSRLIGVAVTAHAYPADNLAVLGAIAEARAGDVVIVANDGYTGTSLIGDHLAGMMRNKSIAGFVTDGLVRDRAGILATGLPVFAAGVSPNSPARTGPGTVGLAIQVGGVRVQSGDVVVGDGDGVVVIPREELALVIERLKAVRAAEAAVEAKVRAGAILSDAARELLASPRIMRVR